MSEWLFGFLGGIFATMLGFFLVMCWELYKDKKMEKKILEYLKTELKYNSSQLKENISLLEVDIKALKNKKRLLTTLKLLKTSALDLILINMPKKFLEIDKHEQLTNIISSTHDFNEQIKARQSHIDNNQAIMSFESTLKLTDNLLIDKASSLINQIIIFQKNQIKK